MTGWRCNGCGQMVGYGIAHRCPDAARGVRAPAGPPRPAITDAELLERMRRRADDRPGAIQRAGEEALADLDGDRLSAILRLPRTLLEDTGVIAPPPEITVAWRWTWRPWRARFRWRGTSYEASGWTRHAARSAALDVVCDLACDRECMAEREEVRTYPDVPSHTRQ